MSVKTKACSLLVCFSMVVSSLAVPVLADSTVNAGNAAVEAGYTAADAVNAAWDAAAEAGNTVADVGDVAGDAAVYYNFLGAAGKGKGTMYEKVAKNIES